MHRRACVQAERDSCYDDDNDDDAGLNKSWDVIKRDVTAGVQYTR